jgi:hypothetical protein
MQKSALCLTIPGIALALLAVSQPASADPYRWCAQYGRDGGRNCYFLTIEQCRQTVSGIGGSCYPNPFYTGSDNNGSGRHGHKRYHN